MSIESIRAVLPEYAKDLKLNLGSIVTTQELSTQQLWGTILASAAATKVPRFFTEISEEARENLSEQAYDAALGAASIMAMNNVFYRGRAFLDGSYDDLRPSLRMNIIGKPGVEKTDFELWSFAVSAINGCAHCLHAHDKALQEAGVARESIFEALRIAAIIAGAAQAYALVPQ